MAEPDVDVEMSYLVSQINESFQSPHCNSIVDAVCDVIYSISATMDEDDDTSADLDMIIDSLCFLGESDVLKGHGRGIRNSNNYDASYNVYPTSLTLKHNQTQREIYIHVIDPKELKVGIDIHAPAYSIQIERDCGHLNRMPLPSEPN